MRLQGRVAIVTGSSQGIGKALALGLAKEGASVVIASSSLDRAEATAAEIQEKTGSAAVAIKMDVADEASTKEMARKTLDRFGRIDILVNNAAMFVAAYPRKQFMEIPLDEWDQMMAINIKGPFLCVRAVFPTMQAQGKGKIINIASGSFYRGTMGNMHYVASKAAVLGLTRQMAREFGDYGINVNAITPGLTASEGIQKWLEPEYMEKFSTARAIKRPEYPEDLVGAVAFFASDDSDFITGQTLNVDGGENYH